MSEDSSSSTNTFTYSLAKAKSEIGHAKFDRSGHHGKYASLNSVIDAAKPLADHGIAFIQHSRQVENGVGIETVLYGFGDEIYTGIVAIPVDKKNAHAVGAAMTYAKRYSLSMALGIAGDEDDDAEQIVDLPKNSSGRKPESVSKTVIREMGIVVDEKKREEYQTQLKEVCNLKDDPGIRELIDELNADAEMKIVVYLGLESRLRTFLRAKEKEFKENKEVGDGNH